MAVDPLISILVGVPVALIIGLVTFPWRSSEARRGWQYLLLLLAPPAVCIAIGIAFTAPTEYREMPPAIGDLLLTCIACNFIISFYVVGFRLRQMQVSAFMFAVAAIGGTFLAQIFAAMSVTANWI